MKINNLIQRLVKEEIQKLNEEFLGEFPTAGVKGGHSIIHTETMELYKNPKSIRNFKYGVRGISDKDGNLYVADAYNLNHGGLGAMLSTYKFIPYIYDIYVEAENIKYILWDSNDEGFPYIFEPSDTEVSEVLMRLKNDDIEEIEKMVDAVQKRNPQFKFWLDVNDYIIESKKSIKEGVTKSQYMSGIADLQRMFREGEFKNVDIAKDYYQRALRMGIDNGFINNATRLKINRLKKQFSGILSADELYDVMIKGLDLVLNKKLNESLTQQVPEYFYHATYKPLLSSIKKKGLDTSKSKTAWEDSKSGIVYLANDPNVAESYAESSEMVDDSWLDEIIILQIASKDLDISKLHDDRNVRGNEPSDTYEYHGVIPWSNIKIYKINESINDVRVDLEYLKSLQSDEPFNVNSPLYHLVSIYNLQSVLKNGLIPKKPASSTHHGILKGELFKGVFLSSIDDISSLISAHYLPKKYEYEGILLQIDGTKLNPNLFSIGIEIPLRLMMKINNGEKISRNDYYNQSDEIVYLGVIPPTAIKIIDDNNIDVKKIIKELVKEAQNKRKIKITRIPPGYPIKILLQKLCLLRRAEKVGDEEVVNNTQLGRLRQYNVGFEIID